MTRKKDPDAKVQEWREHPDLPGVEAGMIHSTAAFFECMITSETCHEPIGMHIHDALSFGKNGFALYQTSI